MPASVILDPTPGCGPDRSSAWGGLVHSCASARPRRHCRTHAPSPQESSAPAPTGVEWGQLIQLSRRRACRRLQGGRERRLVAVRAYVIAKYDLSSVAQRSAAPRWLRSSCRFWSRRRAALISRAPCWLVDATRGGSGRQSRSYGKRRSRSPPPNVVVRSRPALWGCAQSRPPLPVRWSADRERGLVTPC
jgi:hypothetical protein